MAEVWFISDTHLGHKNILKFKNYDGTMLRDFSSIYEMEEVIFDNWSKTVSPQDKVYHLGDVAFTKYSLARMKELPGHKRLVRGNHDTFKTSDYLNIFEEIHGVRQIDGYWFTHIPMHPECLGDRAKLNVHGHLHKNFINDCRYLNVSVEQINYTPINFDEIKSIYEHYKENSNI